MGRQLTPRRRKDDRNGPGARAALLSRYACEFTGAVPPTSGRACLPP
jgi:hypothetical protein